MQAPPPTTVLVVAAELMAATRIEAILAPLGCHLTFAPPEVSAITALLSANRWAAVVLDLAMAPATAAQTLREAQTRGVPVVAFGSHVASDQLAAARAGGAAAVLTRGELAHALAPIIAKHIARTTQP